MTRRIGVAVSTTLAAGLAALTVALPTAASAGITQPGPTAHEGNATTCQEAGLSGDIILFDDKPEKGQQTVTINPADVAGYDVTGTVVKGGDNYNVYPPSILTNLRAPDNNGGQQPDLSHWFVCGTKKDTTSSPNNPPENPPGNPPSSGSSSAPAGGSSSSSSAPAAQGSVVSSTELADTGFSATAPLVGAGALILLGGGLLLALRRTRRRG
jgi:LPXTG-motif cell wall-anchored protein